jgi:GTP-binding protein YchF
VSTSLGLVGLPNAGKTTLFNALTTAGAPAESYPFCTVEKNVAVVTVPDSRLDQLALVLRPEEVVPTTLQVIDIAGLVRGASTGEGLGNRFLDEIRGVDAILHVVRCFSSPTVARVDGSTDATSDLELVDTELVLSDLEVAQRRLDQTQKKAKAYAGGRSETVDLYDRVVRHLERGALLSSMELVTWEQEHIKDDRFLTAKPCVVIANTDERDTGDTEHLVESLRQAAGPRTVFPIAAGVEAEIGQLEPGDRIDFFRELGLGESRVPALLSLGFQLLGLITFYTVARNKLHAWRIPMGGSALQAAGLIHSDMADGFIRADVFTWEELLQFDSLSALRSAGRIRSEGKEYGIADGDVLFVHFTSKRS